MSRNIEAVAAHYDKYPYPSYPLFASGRWKDLERVDLKSWGVEANNPKLWLVGCGTIAPLMFGRRNPRAKILATDLSMRSIQRARLHCWIHGVKNIQFEAHNFLDTSYDESFDAIDAYGVVHHTPNPEESIRHLLKALKPKAVLRLMIYSRETRSELEEERKKWLGKDLHIRELRNQIPQKLMDDFSELKTKSGMADALLHPLVHVYSRSELESLINKLPSVEVRWLESRGNHRLYLKKN